MADRSSAPGPSNSSGSPPAPRLDRSALERVLARAAELQTGDTGAGDDLTEEQLLDLGKEVGLSAQNLRQALAEERTRSAVPANEHGLGAAIFGPSRASAARVVPGKPADVLAAIDTWMQRQELLIVKRHLGDRIIWEPHHGVLTAVRRAFKAGGRDYALTNAFEVSATVIAVDDARVHVGLDADLRSHSMHATGQVAGTTAIGAAATVSLFVMGIATAVAVAPVIVAPLIGIGGARALTNRAVTRSQLALEQLLDRLERSDMSPPSVSSFLGAIVAAATAPPRRNQ